MITKYKKTNGFLWVWKHVSTRVNKLHDNVSVVFRHFSAEMEVLEVMEVRICCYCTEARHPHFSFNYINYISMPKSVFPLLLPFLKQASYF